MDDPIVQEVHETRQRILAECNGDLERLIARLKAARHLVELLETGGQTRQIPTAVHERVDVIDGIVHLDAQGTQRTPRLLLAQAEDPRLGSIEELIAGPALVVAQIHDLSRRRNQGALQ